MKQQKTELAPWEEDYGPEEQAPWEVDYGEPAPEETIGKIETLLRSGGQGLTMGLSDEAIAAVKAPFSDKSYRELQEEEQALNEAAMKANPKTYITGEIGGALLPVVASTLATLPAGGSGGMATGGMTAARLAPALTKALAPTTLKGLGTLGAISGFGHSKEHLTDNPLGLARDTGEGAAEFVAFGKAGEGVVNMAAPVLRKFLQSLRKPAEALEGFAGREGLKALNLPFSALKRIARTRQSPTEAGLTAVKEGIVKNPILHPLSQSTESQLARAQALKGLAGGQMGAVEKQLEQAGLRTFQPGRAATPIEQAGRELAQTEVGLPMAEKYMSGARDIRRMGIQPEFAGEGFVGLKQAETIPFSKVGPTEKVFRDIAYKKGMPQESQMVAQDVKRAIGMEKERAIHEAAKQSGNPELMGKYLTAKKTYGPASNITRELEEQVLREEGRRTLGLTDIGMGSILLGTKGAGEAIGGVMGKKLLERTYHPMMATSAEAVSRLLKTAPEKLGKYAPVLQNAIQRGTPQAFSSTIYLMQQKDPEFRKTMEDLSEEKNSGE